MYIKLPMHLCFLFARAISGPKKVSNSGPTPITGPRNAYFPPEIHYFPLHKKHRCINSYLISPIPHYIVLLLIKIKPLRCPHCAVAKFLCQKRSLWKQARGTTALVYCLIGSSLYTGTVQGCWSTPPTGLTVGRGEVHPNWSDGQQGRSQLSTSP